MQLKDLIDGKEVELKDLKNKIIAVDSSMWLYQFLSSIRGRDGSLFTDSKGRVTSHLIGLSSRIPNLMKEGIKLVFVFDGAPPELKGKERERRKEAKIQAELKFKKAEKKEDFESMKKYAVMTTRLTSEMIEDAKELISAFGIPMIEAKSEAEAQAAFMVKNNDAYAVASNDYDSFLFGAQKVVRNLNIVGKRKKAGAMAFTTVKAEIINLTDVLNHLGIDQEQLIALGMIVGTDFNVGGIKGIGPKGALKLVKEYKNNFEELFKKVEWNDYFDYPWTEVFYLIKKMPVKTDYEARWTDIDFEKLKNILVDKHNFSVERVEKIAKMFEKDKKAKQQKGLGEWC